MYSDLFEQMSRGRGAPVAAAPPPLVEFKAGKMILTPHTSTGTANDGGGVQCVADPARGEIRLVHATEEDFDDDDDINDTNNNKTLQWQWVDRRTNAVTERVRVRPGCTFERIDIPPPKQHPKTTTSVDRIYVWTIPKPQKPNRSDKNDDAAAAAATQEEEKEEVAAEELAAATSDATASGGGATATVVEYKMYWAQDADPSADDEIVASINQYLAQVAVAKDKDRTAATNAAANNNTNSPVDALSSILENLGIPPTTTTTDASSTSRNPASSSSSAAASPSPIRMNQLTLADLQGAMAGIASASTSSSSAPPAVEDLVTPAAVDALLQDAGARQRLMALLPPEQQLDGAEDNDNAASIAILRDNLLSAPMQSTLRALTRVLTNHPDGCASVIANFQLTTNNNANNNNATTNPIQTFLDAIVASVEHEEAQNEEDLVGEEKEQQEDSMDEEKEE